MLRGALAARGSCGHRRPLLDHDEVIHALLRLEATGFIRRWLLLCHIDRMRPSVPIRTFERKRWVIGIRRPGEPGSKSLTAFAERTGRQVVPPGETRENAAYWPASGPSAGTNGIKPFS